MPARRCTILFGTIEEISNGMIKLRLSPEMAMQLERMVLWIPAKMVEGGSIAKVGETDPAISNWWLDKKGLKDRAIIRKAPAS